MTVLHISSAGVQLNLLAVVVLLELFVQFATLTNNISEVSVEA